MVAARYAGTEFGLQPPRTLQGDTMSDKPSEKLQSDNTSTPPTRSRLGFVKKLKLPKLTRMKLIVGFVLVIGSALAFTAYVLRPEALSLKALRNVKVLQDFLSASRNDAAIQAEVKSVFLTNDNGELISSETVLGTVGRNPVDPTRILIATFSRNGTHSTNLPNDPVAESQESETEQQKANDTAPPDPSAEATFKQEPETVPAVKPERVKTTPDNQEKRENKTSTETSKKKAGTEKPSTAKDKEASAQASTESEPKPAVTSPPAVTGIRVTPRSEQTSSTKPQPEEADTKDKKKLQDYQVPGSLLVDLKNYKGKPIPWGLMVILDDSAFMGRKTKTWKPNRMDAAIKFVKGVSQVITPGSKIAVRDFYCSKENRRGRRAHRCLSRLLANWSNSPFVEMKNKLNETVPTGVNQPCAAIAHAVKTDMLELNKLYPRVVVVTGGASRCPYARVLKALRSAKSNRPVHVDVIGVGMPKKNKKAY